MLFRLGAYLLPPLLVFGVYHLLTWFDVLGINKRVFWRQVALTSAICHVLLVSGFLVFSYVDFQAHLSLEPADLKFGPYIFTRSDFWRLMSVFDTIPMFFILILFSMLDRAGMNPPGLLALTFGITYVIGTVQWFFVGGGAGLILERFFQGLKTPDPEEDWESDD